MDFMKLICQSQPKNILGLTYQQQHVLVSWGLLHGSEIIEKTVRTKAYNIIIRLWLQKTPRELITDQTNNSKQRMHMISVVGLLRPKSMAVAVKLAVASVSAKLLFEHFDQLRKCMYTLLQIPDWIHF